MGNLGLPEILLLAVVGIFLIPGIFYLLTLQNTLKAVSPENRKMAPANVWLLLIPLFNIVWIFIVVTALANSLQREYEKYSVFKTSKPTYGIGMAMIVLQLSSIIIPFANIAALVSWVIHWVQVNQCKNEILGLHIEPNLAEGEKSIFL
jgi:uncharacterized protein YacL